MISGLAVVLAAVTIPGDVPPSEMSSKVLRLTVQPGDLIFRTGTGWRAGIVASQTTFPYTHVGIVASANGRLVVIHADPDAGYGRGYVHAVSLASFYSSAVSTSFAVYRPRVPRQTLQRALEYSRKLAETRTPFDNNFDLLDEEFVYCTELLWRAFSAKGALAPPTYLTPVPLLGHAVLFPGDLLRSIPAVRVY